MYEKGIGVPQDDKQAVNWYRKAAEQGDGSAQLYLGWMYYRSKMFQDNKQAYMWFDLAKYNGMDDMKYNFDIITKNMTSRDISEAQEKSKICLESDYKDCD